MKLFIDELANKLAKKKILLLFLIVLVGGFLRFYKLEEYPIHLGHDEVTQLYDAISLARTGRDIYSHPFPFIFESVHDFKPPFLTYATALSYFIFGWRELTIRVIGAFFGTLSILGVFFFSQQFLKDEKVALLAAGLTAIAPFEVFYSRKSFENQTGILLMLFGFVLLHKYFQENQSRFLNWGLIILGISSYVYFSQAVLIPLLLLVFYLINFPKFKKVLIPSIFLFLLVTIPLYYMIATNPDARNRSRAVFITQDPKLGQEIGTSSGWQRWLVLGKYGFERYLKQFDPKYLFLEGLDMTNGQRDLGPLFVVTAPFLLIGGYLLIKQKTQVKERCFILAWILLGMVPSGLTFEDYSPHRAIMVFTMLSLVTAVGISWFGKKFGRIGFCLVLVLLVLNLAFFVKRYTVNFPIERSEALHYPYQQVAEYAWEHYDEYEQIIFDPKFGEFAPWIGTGAHYYLAFYGHYPPEKMQAEFRTGDLSKRETLFGKFSIRAINWNEDKKEKKILLIASPWSLTENAFQEGEIIQIFYFRTTAPAFYAFRL